MWRAGGGGAAPPPPGGFPPRATCRRAWHQGWGGGAGPPPPPCPRSRGWGPPRLGRDFPPGTPPPRGPAGRGTSPSSRTALAASMSRHAGVVRDRDGLEHLLGTLARAPLGGPGLDLPLFETTSLHTVCTLVAVAALARTESRGCHRRRD